MLFANQTVKIIFQDNQQSAKKWKFNIFLSGKLGTSVNPKTIIFINADFQDCQHRGTGRQGRQGAEFER